MIAYNIGHREYYNQFESMTSENLHDIVLNVMLYCLLKILSFCVLCVVLIRRMGLSAIHLVAFVLGSSFQQNFAQGGLHDADVAQAFRYGSLCCSKQRLV